MAESLQDLRVRIKATANVAKLTGVMKMVASAKARAAEEALVKGRPFGESLMSSVSFSDEDYVAKFEGEDADVAGKKQLLVLLTTDKGLCGSVNSTIARMMDPYIAKQKAKGYDVSLFVLGEKGRSQIVRNMPEATAATVVDVFDKEPIFPLAASIAENICNQDYDVATVVYNRFVNAATFTTEFRHFPNLAGAGGIPDSIKGYEIAPDDVQSDNTMVNLSEFAVGGALFYQMLETQACEISQRVTAMDNASKNAGEMVDRFTLRYNRARQARITTELTEIISGAESIAEEED